MNAILQLTCLVALTCFGGQLYGDVVSTFDADLDGWSANFDVAHSDEGGNPGGFAIHTDATDGLANIFAPSKFLGNWSSYAELEFDSRLFESGDVSAFRDYNVSVTSSSGTLDWNGTAATGETPWTEFSIPIQETEWTVSGNWNEIISDVTELKIRIELVSNTTTGARDVTGIDNVRLTAVPEPSFAFILGAAASLLLQRRRRKSKITVR